GHGGGQADGGQVPGGHEDCAGVAAQGVVGRAPSRFHEYRAPYSAFSGYAGRLTGTAKLTLTGMSPAGVCAVMSKLWLHVRVRPSGWSSQMLAACTTVRLFTTSR